MSAFNLIGKPCDQTATTGPAVTADQLSAGYCHRDRRSQLLATKRSRTRCFRSTTSARTGTFSRPFLVGPKHPPGTYTDDTQMTIAVAEALLHAGNRDLDTLMKEMAIRFVEWSRSAQNNRAPGGTCMEGCDNLAKGVPWREAGVADSKGCGSSMRVAPIGLFCGEMDKVAEVARASSLLTHGHDAALEGAAAAACMVTLALQGAAPEDIFSEIDRRCSPNSSAFSATWKRPPELVQYPPCEVLVDEALGEGWVTEEAVASAMYCYWRHPDDYVAAVLTAVNTDGDSDSLAAITGSLLAQDWGSRASQTTGDMESRIHSIYIRWDNGSGRRRSQDRQP